jgi:hypothetical protein
VESFDFRPSSQCILVSVIPSCSILRLCVCARHLSNGLVDTFLRQRTHATTEEVSFPIRSVSCQERIFMRYTFPGNEELFDASLSMRSVSCQGN